LAESSPFAWYSIREKVHNRGRYLVTVAPQWVAEQLALNFKLLPNSYLFLRDFATAELRNTSWSKARQHSLVKCGIRFVGVSTIGEPPGRNSPPADSLDYHITHSSLVKEQPNYSAPSIQPK
jgi:hypothetical protein